MSKSLKPKPSRKLLKSAAVRKRAEFAFALKSFLGHLEGTKKSAHTLKNYRLDLLAFHDFLAAAGKQGAGITLARVTPRDLERYQEHLCAQGLKTNTRRRKLLTLGKFLKYAASRSHGTLDALSKRIPAPHKIERVPLTFPTAILICAIQALPAGTELEARNRTLLWVLAETGCLVSEAARLRIEDLPESESGRTQILFSGRGERGVPVSAELARALIDLRKRARARNRGSELAFTGFNRFGSLGGAISSRGIELLVRAYAARLGFKELTPRAFRHSVVLHWHAEGRTRDEIRERLGLKTDYAFRMYDPLLRAASSP